MIDNWEHRLSDYIESVREVPFKWGAHDCLTFTNGAVKVMCGAGFADDWLGRYITKTGKPRSLTVLCKEYGFDGLDSALDSRLDRLNGPTYPRGSIVTCEAFSERSTTGQALGISVGLRAVFVGETGLRFIPIDTCERGWACPQ